jgi:alginate O-acetyltransferase complex protein AlgI
MNTFKKLDIPDVEAHNKVEHVQLSEPTMTSTSRFLLTSVGAIYGIKAVALAARGIPRSATSLATFLFAWPGLVPGHFRTRYPAQPIDPRRFMAAWARMIAGIAATILLAFFLPRIPASEAGLAGTAALLLAIHLGLMDLLPWLLRWAGFRVPLLFDRPWAAASLAEFWGHRWNAAFVEMNRVFLLRPACRRLGRRGSRFLLFALSGILHELALSFPAGAGWGMPLAYFLLQGVLVDIEERFRVAGRLWTWFWILAPSPWLFHGPFRRALILPFYTWLHGEISCHTWHWYLSCAVYAAALGHLLILIASFQLPARLGWKQDIPKLTRFTQKIFWAYGLYIVFCIVSFALLTWRLHDSFVAGDPAARWLAGFIATFWTIRLLIDAFWYDHRDWPPGNAMIAGHALVTSLFSALAAVYWTTAFLPAG